MHRLMHHFSYLVFPLPRDIKSGQLSLQLLDVEMPDLSLPMIGEEVCLDVLATPALGPCQLCREVEGEEEVVHEEVVR